MAELKLHKITTTATDTRTEFVAGDKWTISSETDISHLLKEITVDKGVEVSDKFDLKDMSATITLKNDDTVWDDLVSNTYAVSFSDIDNFWGVVQSYSQDKINEVIVLECSGYYKFFLDTLGMKIISFGHQEDGTTYIPGQSWTTIKEYLENYFLGDMVISVDVQLPTGTPDQLDVTRIYELTDDWMIISDFFVELQKQYGAFIYVDGDKVLHFISRRSTLSTNSIDIKIDQYDVSYEDNTYNSIVVNSYWDFSGALVNGTVGDIILLYDDNDSAKSIILNGDVNNIPNKFNYLDLRQKLTSTGTRGEFTYSQYFDRLYRDSSYFTQDVMWNLYKSFTMRAKKISCSSILKQIDLFNIVDIDTEQYLVMNIFQDHKQENMDLTLYKI